MKLEDDNNSKIESQRYNIEFLKTYGHNEDNSECYNKNKKENLSQEKPKSRIRKVVIILLFLSIIFFVAYRDISSCISDKEREKEAYTLDYELENTIADNIESSGSINLVDMVNIDFNKICVYSSYSMLEAGKDGTSFKRKSKLYNEEIPKNNFSYIVFLDKDENIVKSLVLNKKYDILGDRSYIEYSKKDSTLKFEKIKEANEYIYKLK
ncbi:hypothetical protein MJU95_016605 [Clostridioides difficile]|nr:hypothetical protein [Clostridioides difficile]